ncbi:MAG: DUF1178 family protein [Pseudolabrys sp.]|nr:DUF1178 family protein [Pseudolabrys sp.]
MIRYSLICDKQHAFESWFQDSTAFDKQVKRKLVTCPQCHSAKVEKAIMAPRITTSKKRSAAAAEAPAEVAVPAAPAPLAMVSPQEQEIHSKLKELRDHLVKNSDNVGPQFPEQARKMHYGEIEHRSIYGVASPDDAKALAEEGIEFHPIPVLPDDRN